MMQEAARRLGWVEFDFARSKSLSEDEVTKTSSDNGKVGVGSERRGGAREGGRGGSAGESSSRRRGSSSGRDAGSVASIERAERGRNGGVASDDGRGLIHWGAGGSRAGSDGVDAGDGRGDVDGGIVTDGVFGGSSNSGCDKGAERERDLLEGAHDGSGADCVCLACCDDK